MHSTVGKADKAKELCDLLLAPIMVAFLGKYITSPRYSSP